MKSVVYYNQSEFNDVVYNALEKAFLKTDAFPSRDLTTIGLNDGTIEYGIRGETVLKTKREKEGFVILYEK